MHGIHIMNGVMQVCIYECPVVFATLRSDSSPITLLHADARAEMVFLELHLRFWYILLDLGRLQLRMFVFRFLPCPLCQASAQQCEPHASRICPLAKVKVFAHWGPLLQTLNLCGKSQGKCMPVRLESMRFHTSGMEWYYHDGLLVLLPGIGFLHTLRDQIYSKVPCLSKG